MDTASWRLRSLDSSRKGRARRPLLGLIEDFSVKLWSNSRNLRVNTNAHIHSYVMPLWLNTIADIIRRPEITGNEDMKVDRRKTSWWVMDSYALRLSQSRRRLIDRNKGFKDMWISFSNATVVVLRHDMIATRASDDWFVTKIIECQSMWPESVSLGKDVSRFSK